MRIILVTIGSLIFCAIIFWTIKFWGLGQTYTNYSHPLFSYAEQLHGPVYFTKPSAVTVEGALDTTDNLYLDVATTEDQQLVVAKKFWEKIQKPIRYSKYSDIMSEVIRLSDVKNKLANRKFIFNLSENAQAGHMIFFDELKNLELQNGAAFIVTSPYEALAKALKEVAPAFVYGSTQPEILKIIAMKSMWLIEALTLRADIVIYPLNIKNEKFFDSTLVNELKRRHKKFIIGPISPAERPEALALDPWGIIITK